MKLCALTASLERLISTLEENNLNDGAGRVTQGVNSILVRSVGRVNDIFDIKPKCCFRWGKVISIGDLADVKIGYLSRAGFHKTVKERLFKVLYSGLKGANTSKVLQDVKEKLVEIESSLPKDTKIDIFYDRSTLVNLATDAVKSSLLEAVILIVIVLLLFLEILLQPLA